MFGLQNILYFITINDLKWKNFLINYKKQITDLDFETNESNFMAFIYLNIFKTLM